MYHITIVSKTKEGNGMLTVAYYIDLQYTLHEHTKQQTQSSVSKSQYIKCVSLVVTL